MKPYLLHIFRMFPIRNIFYILKPKCEGHRMGQSKLRKTRFHAQYGETAVTTSVDHPP